MLFFKLSMAPSVCLKNVMVDINPAEIIHGYYDHTNCQIVAGYEADINKLHDTGGTKLD
jgi:hypothetical protein